jgi:hypothetical protein
MQRETMTCRVKEPRGTVHCNSSSITPYEKSVPAVSPSPPCRPDGLSGRPCVRGAVRPEPLRRTGHAKHIVLQKTQQIGRHRHFAAAAWLGQRPPKHMRSALAQGQDPSLGEGARTAATAGAAACRTDAPVTEALPASARS